MRQTADKRGDLRQAFAATLPETDARKKELRRRFAALRVSISPEEKAVADRIIASHVVSLPAFESAATVLLYASYDSEPDTRPIAEQAFRLGKTVTFPRTDPVSHRIAFYAVVSTDALIPGFRGIPEPPQNAPAVVPDADTFCLVPGYAFDRDGYRLGYGGGYYDRFLSGDGASCVAVGACYDRLFLTEPLPRDAFDRRVSLIVTEKGVFPTHG